MKQQPLPLLSMQDLTLRTANPHLSQGGPEVLWRTRKPCTMKGGTALTKQGLPTGLPCFTGWLIKSHRLLLVRWAQLFIIVMCASMLHPMGRLLVYRLYSIGFIISALGITLSASTAQVAYKKVQFWFAAFSLLQFMVVCQMAYIGAAPAVHSYLDWATNLTTLVPQMLVLDLSTTKLILFLLMHAGAETAFYLSVVAHSLPVAVIRATCLYSVVALVFLSFRRQAYAAYLFHSQGLPPKHAEAPLPSKPREYAEVEQQGQEEAGLIRAPPIHAYRSRMRRKRGVGGLAQQPLANLHRSMVDMAGAWFARLNQGSTDSAAPRVSVQVSDLVSSITAADQHISGVPPAAALYPDPSPALGPSLPKCTISLPSAALLMPPLEQTNQHQKLSQPRTSADPVDTNSSMNDCSTETSEKPALVQLEQGAVGVMTAAPARAARLELPFEVLICPSADLGDMEVLGWEGEEDSPEEDSRGCMRLLASMAGQFMPLRVLQHLKQGCRHAVQGARLTKAQGPGAAKPASAAIKAAAATSGAAAEVAGAATTVPLVAAATATTAAEIAGEAAVTLSTTGAAAVGAVASRTSTAAAAAATSAGEKAATAAAIAGDAAMTLSTTGAAAVGAVASRTSTAAAAAATSAGEKAATAAAIAGDAAMTLSTTGAAAVGAVASRTSTAAAAAATSAGENAATAAEIAGEAAVTLSTTGAAAVGAVASRTSTAAAAAATSAGEKAATAAAIAGDAAMTLSTTGAAAVGAVASRTSKAAAAAATSAGAKVSRAGAVVAATLSSAAKEKKRAQQEWRQAQQASSTALGAVHAHDFPSYSVWLLTRYKTLITRWAVLFFVVSLSHVVHPDATPVMERPYLNFNIMMLPASTGMALASQQGAYSMVKLSMFVFWLLQVLTTVQMTVAGASPAVHKYLDLGTSLVTAVPYMAGFVNGVCLIAFTAIRRNMRKNYFKEMEKANCGPPLAAQCDAS
ncbi:hypothetical protein DUNSADRAFT_1936 [Dunaliella salina]|uniref:Uncharacterized protein n=1 Tax=Dunaliella salina TaxID=3046 RepID=A0ABQ7FWU3_DUNSA|nr:hypothetical protein DUNSADRAFT_1936 [Dunaliella salina]|eukprot:KAF5826824.1 hypothetical protein DUNSADRAFT_1936 [Dunaliella salina]